MSDTPLTDAAAIPYFAIRLPRFPDGQYDTSCQWVPAGFARDLEREFNTVVKQLAEQRELHVMQLAAISTVSISNTESTIGEVDKCHEDYKTTAFNDVVRAIRREMKLIEENKRLLSVARQACDERYEEEQRATYERSKRK